MPSQNSPHSGKERREASTLAMEARGQACWHTRPMMLLHTSAGCIRGDIVSNAELQQQGGLAHAADVALAHVCGIID